jgi:predicted metalloprotease with PDZ domain
MILKLFPRRRHCFLFQSVVVALLLIGSVGKINAQTSDTICYTISLDKAIHHEADINISLNVPEQQDVFLVMSKASPGRYAVHNFAKNIYNLKVQVENNAITESIVRLEPDVWKVPDVKGQISISCTLFGNQADGTYATITDRYAILNMPATLPWIKSFDKYPVKLTIDLPDTSLWKIATQLPLLDSANHVYFAPNLQYLMDSPLLIGNLTWKTLKLQHSPDSSFYLALLGDFNKTDLDTLAFKASKVIDEQKMVYGEFPDFDFGNYIFLAGYGPEMNGDGMEHRNSTVITQPSTDKSNVNDLIGTISHEFFHVWNMERIRPSSLEPFDFTKANVCGELWFGEGFTSYYGDLALCRAGIMSTDEYLTILGRKINMVLNSPGWHFGSPVYMSEMAVFTDQAAAADVTNFQNTFLSYYSYGEAIALALDLRLRTEFKGKSLDDLMKLMWSKFGKTGIGYSNKDIQNALAEITGNAGFAVDFFQKHIYSNQMPDFEALFARAGYKFVKKNPGRTSIGFLRLQFENGKCYMASSPLFGSPVYEAGIIEGDEILLIDGQPVTDYAELNYIVGTRRAGDEIKIRFIHHGTLKNRPSSS